MAAFLIRYKKGMDHLARIESATAMTCMALLILMNGLGIFTRYFLNRPILWVHELSILIGTWLFYIGTGLLFTRKEDITLEIIVNKLPRSTAFAIETMINVILLVFLVILTISTYYLIPFVRMSGSMLSFSLGISDVYYYIPVGVGAILIFIPILYTTLQKIERYGEEKG